MKTISKHRDARKKINIATYYIIAYILILFGYYEFIVPIYGYNGFSWNPDKGKIIESMMLVFIIPLLLPARFKRPSDLLLHIQFLFPILPMLVLYGAEGCSRYFLYATVTTYLLMIFIVSTIRVKPIRIARLSPIMFQRLLLLISWAYICSIVLLGGMKYLNFDLLKVYDFRADAAENLPGIYAYFSPLVSKVVLPFSLLLAVVNKNRLAVFASIAGSIMMLGLTAHKGPIFYPLAVLGVYYILQKGNVIKWLLIAYITIVVISNIDLSNDLFGRWVGSLMLRRTYLIPASTNFAYYELFSEIQFVFWSASKITFGLIEYPYDIPSSILVGREIYGFDMNANTGWIGSGYMNAGVIGMLIYSIITGLLMVGLNAYRKAIEKRIIVAITIAPMFIVMSTSDLPTAILSHGVLLSFILCSLFSYQTDISRVKEGLWFKKGDCSLHVDS